jgi:hypothetical protein
VCKERKQSKGNARMSLIALMALPGVFVAIAVDFFTGKAKSAGSPFVVTELLWLLALALVAVLSTHT